jgi:hypothetical protein
MNTPAPISGQAERSQPGTMDHAAIVSDILAVITETSPWSLSARVAAHLAAQWGSTLTGCFVESRMQDSDVERGPTVLSLLNERAEMRSMSATGRQFTEFARSHDIEQTRWVVVHCGLLQTLRRLDAAHDLAVVERDLANTSEDFDLLGEALLTCRMPYLVLPPGMQAMPMFERVAIGWNGSLNATRAIRAALPILAAARDVCILDGTLGENDDDCTHEWPRFDPSRYLARHGIVARRQVLAASPAASGSALLGEAHRMQAGLLVMGAYGRWRLSERIMGGATSYMLGHADIPLFMNH